MTVSQYFLSPHAFVCSTKRYWLILDVTKDRYLCVERRQFDALGPWLHGWSSQHSTAPQASTAVPPEIRQLATELVAKGILSESPYGTKEIRPLSLPKPTAARRNTQRGSSIRLWLFAPVFFLACNRADWFLRRRPFEQTIQMVSNRNRRNRHLTPVSDFERLEYLVSIFLALRLFYSHPYVCLFDSLALVEFLAHFAVFPKWVFAVAADPFSAHCWVQEGHVVLNDTLARIVPYTPIMCI